MAVRREYVSSLYRDLLGREGADHEVEGWTNAPDENAVRSAFLGSPEYTSKHGGQPTWQDVGGVITPVDDVPTSSGYDGGGQASASSGAPTGVTTDQWAGSAPINPGGNFGSLAGFDADNFNNALMQTAKYQNGRIFARYDPTGGAAQLLNDPDFRRNFPNARVVDVDKIDYGDGRPVDVIQDYGTPNARWAWQTADNSGAPGGVSSTSGGGGAKSLTNLLGQLGGLGQQYAGPGGPGQTKGPLEQVGQDPLSLLISGGLVDIIGRGGATPFGEDVGARLMSMIDSGGELDEAATRRRFESSRELIDKARRTMINDARGDLASRNLLSEPGIAQGVEAGTMGRITESLAAEFARAQRDIISDEADRADTRVQNALSLATGLAADQAKTFLAGLGEGTARQLGLAQVALQSLEQNQAWNMFLAEYGLKRDTVLAELQNGRVDDVMQLLNSFLSLASLSRGGYV